MAELIKMPRLSDTMEEGTVATWFKKVGDSVKEGEILAEIETDKATMEFESFYEGTLLYIGINENETAKVDAPLAIIGDPGDDIDSILANNEVSSNDKKDQNIEPAAVTNETEKKEISQPQVENTHVITMPRLSDTMEEGTVASWFKKVGDSVDEGEILAEIETDKATMEFESFYSGTLLHIGLNEGDSAKVDSLLAVIGPNGADISSILENPVIPKIDSIKETNIVQDEAPQPISEPPKVIEKDVVANNKRIFISPLARKLANDKNIDISKISGTGENGRIVKSDVENFQESIVKASVSNFKESSESLDYSEVNHSQMRKVIAKRLSESKFSAPHYYLNIKLDMSETIAFRKQCNSIPNTKISFNDIIIKACAVALKNNPSVNSQWFDDKIRYNNFVNIGVAVGVEDGLIVPVLKNADKMTVADISKSVKEMASLARDKKLTPEMMQGSTFTISNLGMFGIESFTSIINSPNSVILSVGAIVQEPVVKDGEIVVGNTMKLTLACDHRVVDGLTGAKFLQVLKPLIENPLSMLI
jgi:pyruvate dehydrogenase E2 component (dihydrolipoamide acetyltransferase)